MQQARTIRVSPWYRSVATLGAASLALVLLVGLAGIWAVGRQGMAPSLPPAGGQPQPRPALSPRFADEAAYVPAVEEYLSPALGEEYLPVAPAPATRAAAVRAQPGPFASPRFADEAAYVPAVEEYLSPALGEEYLPVTPAIAARPFASPLSARILADELAGSAFPALVSVGDLPAEASLPVPAAGPR